LENGSKLPDFDQFEWIGKRPKLRGKPILVFFWSISCYDCKTVLRKLINKEWPLIDQFDIVSVHMPRSEKDTNTEQLNQFRKDFKIPFPILNDNKLHCSTIFRNQFVPTVYLFSADEVLVGKVFGSNPFRRLEHLYKKYLL
jgi:thiol-disulfide isomerase/thioredoxin